MCQISVEVFVAASRKVDDDGVVRAELFQVEYSECMGAFKSWNDALSACEVVGGIQSLAVGDGEYFGAP